MTDPPPSAAAPTLLRVGDELGHARDLVDAANMAADSLEIGRAPLMRLLDVINKELQDAINQLDNIREAAQ